MKHLGDYDASTVVYGKFTTYRPSTGAAYTLAGTPALSVYKDNSTTQSTTGVTLTADFDSVTGLNHFAIDTSADGTFYSAGSFFDIVITTGTVDSVSVVGTVVASFTIRKNSALKPATAGRTLVVDAAGLADANTVKIGPTGSGTAQTARDIGASVLLSAGTGTGQLDFTSGVVKANVTQYGGVAGTFASGRAEVNASHIAGSAVSTSTAQIGVNVVNFGGAAGTFASGRPEVNATHWSGTILAAADTAGYPKVTIKNGTGTGELSLSSGAVKIQSGLKRGSALADFEFPMVDSSDVLTTGLTVTGTISKDGGAFASLTNAVAEVSGGTYAVDLTASEMTADNVTLMFAATGAKTLTVTIRTDP